MIFQQQTTARLSCLPQKHRLPTSKRYQKTAQTQDSRCFTWRWRWYSLARISLCWHPSRFIFKWASFSSCGCSGTHQSINSIVDFDTGNLWFKLWLLVLLTWPYLRQWRLFPSWWWLWCHLQRSSEICHRQELDSDWSKKALPSFFWWRFSR